MRPFLYNLFSDRQIIKLGPSFLQKPLAWTISALRSKKTEAMYAMIGGKSPIVDITAAQAQALEEVLHSSLVTRHSSLSFKVYIGMRYWHPFIEETVRQIYSHDIRKVVALSLYPHYSIATTGSSLSRLTDVIKQYPIEVSEISSWFNHPMYIDALVDVIKKGIESFNSSLVPRPSSIRDIHVLFSAHSLPMSVIEAGDPYVFHIKGTIEGVAKRVDIKWHLSYQSRSGHLQWLKPSTDDKIKELAGKGVKDLLIVPISFVSDHIETLYEIDILYKRLAGELGISLVRAESLNTNPLFIKALAEIVIAKVIESGWLNNDE